MSGNQSQPVPAPSVQAPVAGPARGRRRWTYVVIAAVIVLAGGAPGVWYWRYAEAHEWTDDAFIDGHIIRISSRVPGRVVRVLVDDNQPVKAGDVLVEIDPRDFAVRAAQARAVLAFLIGAPAVENPLVDGFEVPAVPDLAELQRQAAGARPDLAAARALIAAAEKGLGAAYAEYFPSISIDFDYFLTRQAFPQTSHWLFGASMYLPIFSGGRIHADVRTAHSLVRQAMYYQSMTERKAAEEVTVAWQSLQASGEKVKELGAAVSAASQAFQLADQAYDVGLATNLERLVAQDRLLQAELQLAAETLSRKTLYLRLVEAVGKLADEASSLASPPAKGLTAETAVKENGS